MADQQGEAPSPSPKIVIDSDWKAQAQKEREKLSEKDRQSKEAAEKAKHAHAAAPASPGHSGMASAPGSAAQGGGGGMSGEQGMPPADFQTLVGTMVTQALMYMGAFPDPETGRAVVSLEHARFHIDLLAVLEEKTRNNLTPEEAGDMKQALVELRNRFVEIVQAIAQMKKEGKLKPAAGGSGLVGPGAGGLGGIGGPAGTIPLA